jgi:hypothetical protein
MKSKLTPTALKKYDEEEDLWQARVILHWRFYFLIEADTYLITNITPHPK